MLIHMLRNKEWTASVLRKIGGTARVGRSFLEESFDDAKTASLLTVLIARPRLPY